MDSNLFALALADCFISSNCCFALFLFLSMTAEWEVKYQTAGLIIFIFVYFLVF